MTHQLFSNNAQGTLAGAITNAATTVTLQSGQGALFPAPAANQYFVGTFVDAATGLLREVVKVTGVSADTLTIVRGQESTSAVAWSAGDIFGLFPTAGTLNNLAQLDDLQKQAGNYAADTSGSPNTITATLPTVPDSYAALTGSPVRIKLANTNTSTTVNVNLHAMGNVRVYLPDGSAPGVGTLVSGSILELKYDGTKFQVSGGYTAALVASWSTSVVSTSQSVGAANTLTEYVNTAAVTLTIAQTTTLGANWLVSGLAYGGIVTININGSDVINGGSAGVGASVPAGWEWQLATNAGGALYLSSSPALSSVLTKDSGSNGYTRNLKISVTSGTAVTATADVVVTTDGTNFQVLGSFSKSISTASSGAGGLDTGTIGASAWYYVWAVAKPDGTNAAMISLSSTAPTMPSGYTFKTRIGVVRTNGSSSLLGTIQTGKKVQYINGGANLTALPTMASGSSGSVSTPTWTAVAVGTFVPPTATAVGLYLYTTGSTIATAAPNNSYGGYLSTTNPPPTIGRSDLGTGIGSAVQWYMLESSNIYYAANGACQLQCFGWEDNI